MGNPHPIYPVSPNPVATYNKSRKSNFQWFCLKHKRREKTIPAELLQIKNFINHKIHIYIYIYIHIPTLEFTICLWCFSIFYCLALPQFDRGHYFRREVLVTPNKSSMGETSKQNSYVRWRERKRYSFHCRSTLFWGFPIHYVIMVDRFILTRNICGFGILVEFMALVS